jgi:hypothetical protein
MEFSENISWDRKLVDDSNFRKIQNLANSNDENVILNVIHPRFSIIRGESHLGYLRSARHLIGQMALQYG